MARNITNVVREGGNEEFHARHGSKEHKRLPEKPPPLRVAVIPNPGRDQGATK